MYTANWPKEVRKIASDFMTNPVQANIGSIDQLVANKSITQHVELLTYPEKQRLMMLLVVSMLKIFGWWLTSIMYTVLVELGGQVLQGRRIRFFGDQDAKHASDLVKG